MTNLSNSGVQNRRYIVFQPYGWAVYSGLINQIMINIHFLHNSLGLWHFIHPVEIQYLKIYLKKMITWLKFVKN